MAPTPYLVSHPHPLTINSAHTLHVGDHGWDHCHATVPHVGRMMEADPSQAPFPHTTSHLCCTFQLPHITFSRRTPHPFLTFTLSHASCSCCDTRDAHGSMHLLHTPVTQCYSHFLCISLGPLHSALHFTSFDRLNVCGTFLLMVVIKRYVEQQAVLILVKEGGGDVMGM